MTEAPYHHVCLLVPDMRAAVSWFSDVLGVTFREPQRMATSGRIDPAQFGDEEPHTGESYVTFSIEGPPYYELGEARGNGLHSLARHGAGPHHVGVFVPDVDAAIAELAAKGIGTEARMLAPDGSTLVCWSERAPASGLMVEYMHESIRPSIQRWIETGEIAQTASSRAVR
jgi:catechol 2,3-dioxygenase-like lactoylglutathione lyase family enzyme